MVRRAKHLVFHVKCFNCSTCNRQILTGDELYYVGDSKFVCKEDYYQTPLPSKSGESVEKELLCLLIHKRLFNLNRSKFCVACVCVTLFHRL